jgi:hypothetical protein
LRRCRGARIVHSVTPTPTLIVIVVVVITPGLITSAGGSQDAAVRLSIIGGTCRLAGSSPERRLSFQISPLSSQYTGKSSISAGPLLTDALWYQGSAALVWADIVTGKPASCTPVQTA